MKLITMNKLNKSLTMLERAAPLDYNNPAVRENRFCQEIQNQKSLNIKCDDIGGERCGSIIPSKWAELMSRVLAKSADLEHLRITHMFNVFNSGAHKTAMEILATSITIHILDIQDNGFQMTRIDVAKALVKSSSLTKVIMSCPSAAKDAIKKIFDERNYEVESSSKVLAILNEPDTFGMHIPTTVVNIIGDYNSEYNNYHNHIDIELITT